MRILITGATGLIGRKLAVELSKEGHAVFALARTPNSISYLPRENVHEWKDSEIPSENSVSYFDAIIHLAGENIAQGRWTKKRKRQIFDSRIRGTSNLVNSILNLTQTQRPKLFVSASAVGYYGDRGEEELHEGSSPANGFLGELCQKWESVALRCSNRGIRSVRLRFGAVLSPEGGVLAKMGPFILGSGQQWMSWIHIDDVVGFVKHSLKNENVEGVYNLTAPHPVQQKDFIRELSQLQKYPLVFRVPSTVLKLILGEMSEIILGSQKVWPKRTIETGYGFLFPDLKKALASLLGGRTRLDQTFSAEQFVPRPRDQAVPFFSKAENLEELTPPWLNFRIVKKSNDVMSAGTTIDYRLRIHGVPVGWKTLISEWNLPFDFTDEQLNGPYRKWHHVHGFFEVQGGTLLTDHVTYQVPFSWLGKLFLSRWIAKDVRTIFAFRKKKIDEILGS